MQTLSVQGLSARGFHRVAYHQWGDPTNPRVLVCVHGLVRNGRDFDLLADALSDEYRVICPDVVGRGQSDWLGDPAAYTMPQYLADMAVLLARLEVEQVDWLGTSMGGIIGMLLAAMPGTPVRRLILNDIGAFVSKQALTRISDYLQPRYFDTWQQATRFMQATYPALRHLSAQQWQALVQHNYRRDGDRLTQHYDPAIGEASRASAGEDVNLWPVWGAIRCPQLLIWGDASDVLEQVTVEQMQAQNPALSLYRVPGVPHVPSLMDTQQIDRIRHWLARSAD